ncbi:nucleic-acid-binding protein from transposon X-element [Trichonephila clavipes]|nr:nucleic-acid-binding protein from transposon X-element [Trichonephila clavipes]
MAQWTSSIMNLVIEALQALESFSSGYSKIAIAFEQKAQIIEIGATRVRVKASLTRLENTFDEINTRNEISIRLSTLDDLLKEFERLDSTLSLEESEINEFEERYFYLNAKFNDKLDELNARNQESRRLWAIKSPEEEFSNMKAFLDFLNVRVMQLHRRRELTQGLATKRVSSKVNILPRDTVMSGHVEQRAPEDAMQLGTEIPPAALAPANLLSDTFDKDCLDALQLSALIKEKANTELEYATALGELKVLYPCPIKSCHHNKGNGFNSFRPKNERPAESPILPATLILENKNNSNSKKPTNQSKKTNSKTTKNPANKPKQDPKIQEDAIVPTKNSFASLEIDNNTNENDKRMVEDNPDTNETIPENEDVTVTPKVKHIMLRYQTNYNLILKELDRKYPNSVNKLTGQYIKIMASNTDEHREITAALKAQGEEFYSVPHLSERPLEVVIKGLPKSTPKDEIKEDLLNQGVPVMKVSQLTQIKSKFPLPIFLVEVRKGPLTSTKLANVATCQLYLIHSTKGWEQRSVITATTSTTVLRTVS